MPTTRRKRANPPEQPENNNQLETQQSEAAAEASPTESQPSPAAHTAKVEEKAQASTTPSEVNTANSSQVSAAPTTPAPSQVQLPPQAQTAAMNGNSERAERNDHTSFSPPMPSAPSSIEGGRRTVRGELFRRPPQPPVQQVPPAHQAPINSTAPMPAPTHEITLPLGKGPGDTNGDPLHLAYNPGYTGSDEARSVLLHKLVQESKAGGRARCWNCGSIAIIYDRWNTRSKTFGEIGVAICEICGVWSVM